MVGRSKSPKHDLHQVRLDQEGRKPMEDENVTAVRHRSKMRERREHELSSNSLCLSMTKDMSGDDDEEWEDPSVDDMSFQDSF
jgi:hypothetical protein